jgi:NADH-quinone oxidoreductase subunit J
MIEMVLFYSFAAVILAAALLMVTSKNIFHSALYLAFTLFGVAAIFVLLHSYFLAGIQVLIYIGAVVVLTIFVINLTKEITGKTIPQMNGQVIPAILVSILALALIVSAVLKTDWLTRIPASTMEDNTALLGNQLLTNFAVPFEVVSVLLLAALIGAVVIVAKEKDQDKGEDEEKGLYREDGK